MKQNMNRLLNSKHKTPNTVREEAGPTIFSRLMQKFFWRIQSVTICIWKLYFFIICNWFIISSLENNFILPDLGSPAKYFESSSIPFIVIQWGHPFSSQYDEWESKNIFFLFCRASLINEIIPSGEASTIWICALCF